MQERGARRKISKMKKEKREGQCWESKYYARASRVAREVTVNLSVASGLGLLREDGGVDVGPALTAPIGWGEFVDDGLEGGLDFQGLS